MSVSRPYVEPGILRGSVDPFEQMGEIEIDCVSVGGEEYEVWLRKEATNLSEFTRSGACPCWTAKAPALKGCVVRGRTMGEAKAKIRQAVSEQRGGRGDVD